MHLVRGGAHPVDCPEFSMSLNCGRKLGQMCGSLSHLKVKVCTAIDGMFISYIYKGTHCSFFPDSTSLKLKNMRSCTELLQIECC